MAERGTKGVVATMAVSLALGTAACGLIAGLGDFEVVPGVVGDGSINPTPQNDGSVGDGGGGTLLPITTTTPTIDFGDVRCGTTDARREVTFVNPNDQAIDWTATLSSDELTIENAPDGGTFSGTLAPKATATIAVKPTLKVPGAQTVSLTISSPSTTAPLVIDISLKSTGVGIVATPNNIDFGEGGYQNGGGPIPVVLQNIGTEPVTLSLVKTGNEFDISPNSVPIAAGSVGAINTSFKSGPETPDYLTSTIQMSVPLGTALCGGTLPIIPLRGRRIKTDVTTSPGTLEMGSVGCGPNPASKEITISNYSTAGKVDIQTKLSAGARFTVNGPASVEAAPNTTQPATVVLIVKPTSPLMAPIGNADASLEITLNGPPLIDGPLTNTVPLKMHVQGGILEWGTLYAPGDSVFDFQNVNVGQRRVGGLWFQNKGNMTVSVNYTIAGDPAFTIDGPASDSVGTNGFFPDDVTVAFQPTKNGPVQAEVTMTSTSPMCAPLLKGTFKGNGQPATQR